MELIIFLFLQQVFALAHILDLDFSVRNLNPIVRAQATNSEQFVFTDIFGWSCAFSSLFFSFFFFFA